jgi:hypothetical protein
MKKKFLIPIATVFIMALAFSFNNTSSSDNFDVSFIESDNIAFAEGGYSCAPGHWLDNCQAPFGGIMVTYWGKKRV